LIPDAHLSVSLTVLIVASTFAAMRFGVAGFMLLLAMAGCHSNASTPGNASMFAPTGMRIHPIFTQVADVNKTGKPDGIEAQLEFQDQFDDPTKASGQVLFELFDYRRNSPDPRGMRVGGPWVESIASLDQQNARWNTTLRTYRFDLSEPKIRTDTPYVLTAIFESTGGGRFFDQIVLTPTPSPDNSGAKSQALPQSLSPTSPGETDDSNPSRPTSRNSQP
jgi:hypothetical protein